MQAVWLWVHTKFVYDIYYNTDSLFEMLSPFAIAFFIKKCLLTTPSLKYFLTHIVPELRAWQVINQTACPDSKVHGANMGPTWVLSAPDGPHVGPMNLAIRVESAVVPLYQRYSAELLTYSETQTFLPKPADIWGKRSQEPKVLLTSSVKESKEISNANKMKWQFATIKTIFKSN